MKSFRLAIVPAAMALMIPAAMAQQASGVVISGRVDLGVLRTPNNLKSNTDTGSNWQVAESSNARLNFSGREEISPDLTAFFMIEHRFNADTGIVTDSVNSSGTLVSAPFWKDKSWVGLVSKQYGEVKLGRVHSPQYGLGVAGRFEAFFGDSLGSNGTRGARSANQWDDSIYYTSPSFNGVNVGVIVQDAQTSPSIRDRGVGGHVHYVQNNFQIAFTTQKEQDRDATSVLQQMTTNTLGGWLDVPGARLMFTWAKSSDLNPLDTGSELVYTVGARVPAGPGEVRVSYRKRDDDQRKTTKDFSSDEDSKRLGVGYHYPLSKRTSINSSLVRESIVTYNANGTTKTDRSGTSYEVALRHQF